MEDTYEKSIFENEPQMQIVYTGFWERLGALILDWLVLLPLTIANYFNTERWGSVSVSVVISVVAIVYKPLLEYLFGATLGKKGLAITVVNKSYGKITAGEAILRNIFQIITGLAGVAIAVYSLQHGGANHMASAKSFGDFDTATVLSVFFSLGIFVLYLADAICLVANPKKQSLHDLIAGTYVIKKIG